MSNETLKAHQTNLLKQAVGFTDAQLQSARKGAEDVFVWNVTLDSIDMQGWSLQSDQFVQLGEDHQLATGLWSKDSDASVVRTDIEARRDADGCIEALVRRLAGVQSGKYVEDPPTAWTGLRFVSEPPGSALCLKANMLVDLISVEGADADIASFSDQLILNILNEDGGDIEDIEDMDASRPTPAAASAAAPRAFAARGVRGGQKKATQQFEINQLMKAPTPSQPDQPITRTDRPPRMVVRSKGGRPELKARSLERIFHEPDDDEVSITLKEPGEKRSIRLRLKPSRTESNSEG